MFSVPICDDNAMSKIIGLGNMAVLELQPKPPYNFNANFHKPSHFPSSDTAWEEDNFWISMIWKEQELGLKFKNIGTIDEPRIKIKVYSRNALSKDFIANLIPEIRWRFNFDSDISEFYEKFKDDRVLGPAAQKWKGMKPIAASSLYEILIVFIVLQNATVRRTVQMLENMFHRYGKKIEFEGKILSAFWEASTMAMTTEQELRNLKLGYRARFLIRIAQQFVNKEIDELALRHMSRDKTREQLLSLYGIGPVSAGGLLFEGFYFCNTLETIPPWERKIMSRIIFNKKSVPAERMLGFFRHKYKDWEALAFHYIWEDLFWRRKHEHIEWLEKEIRL